MSFSAEINDFVNGAKAGAAIGGDIQDRKLRREKFEADQVFREGSAARAERALDIREKGIGSRAADREARAAAKASDKEAKASAKAAEKEHNSFVRSANDTARSADGKSSKSPSTTYPDSWEDDESDTDEEDYPEGDPALEEEDITAIPVPEVTGEKVLFSNAGGLMEEEDPDEGKGGLEVAEAAIPVEAPAKGDAPAADPVPAEGKSDPIFKEAAAVTKDVFDTVEAELNEKEEAVSTKPKKSQDRLSEVKAATPEEMKAIRRAVDPTGEMDKRVVGAKELVKVYNFFLEKGDIVKARSIARQILKANEEATRLQGILALDSLRAGDLVSSSKLVTDAYNENVPDGGSIEATPTPKGTVLYKIDRPGYAKQQGEIGAAEMWKLATGMADGSLYIKRLIALAAEAPVGEDVPVVTSGGKKKNEKNWNDAVMEAAQAKVDLKAAEEEFKKAVDLYGSEPTDEKDKAGLEAAKKALEASRKTFTSAVKTVKRGQKKTGRKTSDVAKDMRDASELVSPGGNKVEEKAEPADGAAIPDGVQGVAPATADAAAIPEMPTAPTPVAPAVGKPIDAATMAAAKAAIEQGRSRAGVLKKLQDAGYDTRGL